MPCIASKCWVVMDGDGEQSKGEWIEIDLGIQFSAQRRKQYCIQSFSILAILNQKTGVLKLFWAGGSFIIKDLLSLFPTTQNGQLRLRQGTIKHYCYFLRCYHDTNDLIQTNRFLVRTSRNKFTTFSPFSSLCCVAMPQFYHFRAITVCTQLRPRFQFQFLPAPSPIRV